MAPLDQLYYSWVNEGVEGRNRFQIAAVSAGLAQGARASLLPLVRSICRYDFDRQDPDAVSFGWTEAAGHRFAFYRAPVARTGKMVGNFTAHVLVGAPEDMPGSEIARRWGSEFWWRGWQPENLAPSTELPQLDLSEVRESQSYDAVDPRPIGVALALNRGSRPLLVRGGSQLLGSAMRAVAERCPELADRHSFSTHEGSPGPYPLRVVGTRLPGATAVDLVSGRTTDIDDKTSFLIDRMLENSERAERFRRSIRLMTTGQDPSDQPSYMDAARIVDMAETGKKITPIIVQLATESPDLGELIAGNADGRRELATQINRGRVRPRELTAINGQLSVGSRKVLARTIADVCEEGVVASNWSEIAGVIRSAGMTIEANRMTDFVLETVAEGADLRWMTPMDLDLLLVRASESRTDMVSLESALDTVDPVSLAVLAEDPRIPDKYLAPVFSRLCALRGQDDVWLSHMEKTIRLRPSLLVKDPATSGAVAGVLAGLRPEEALSILVEANLEGELPRELRRSCRTLAEKAIEERRTSTDSAKQLGLVSRALNATGRRSDRIAASICSILAERERLDTDELFGLFAELSEGPTKERLLSQALARTVAELHEEDDLMRLWCNLRSATRDENGRNSLGLIVATVAESNSALATSLAMAWLDTMSRQVGSNKFDLHAKGWRRTIQRAHGDLLNRTTHPNSEPPRDL